MTDWSTEPRDIVVMKIKEQAKQIVDLIHERDALRARVEELEETVKAAISATINQQKDE